jgi:hypothetical protein
MRNWQKVRNDVMLRQWHVVLSGIRKERCHSFLQTEQFQGDCRLLLGDAKESENRLRRKTHRWTSFVLFFRKKGSCLVFDWKKGVWKWRSPAANFQEYFSKVSSLKRQMEALKNNEKTRTSGGDLFPLHETSKLSNVTHGMFLPSPLCV